MKKIMLFVGIFLIIAAGTYLYIRFAYLKAADFKPDTAKEKSVLDLRPSIIAKLKQLVHDGSGGLYILSVDTLNPDLAASKLDVINAGISIDSVVMKQLDQSKKLPDDIFKISFHSLHIGGIGIADLISKNKIDIATIGISAPLIEVYHKKQLYNKLVRAKNDSLSVYQRIMKQMNSIVIGKIEIQQGRLIIYDMAKKNKANRFNNFSLRMDNILLDSSTQNDHNRLLFAKHTVISIKNYIIPTPDSLYYFSVDSLAITGEEHSLTALNVQITPRYNRVNFQKRIATRKEIVTVKIPRITLSGIDWWAMMTHEKFIAKDANLFDGNVSLYFDLSKPRRKSIIMDNYPQQMMMKIPFPFSVTNTNLHHVNLSYEEFHPDINKSGTLSFNDINLRIAGTTNISAAIKKQPVVLITGTCLLMQKALMTSTIKFNLLRYRTGDFSAVVKLKSLDKDIINPVMETLGAAYIKTGTLDSIAGYVEGNNMQARGNIEAVYKDLHITPLKNKADKEGNIRKKTVSSFFANAFLIKNSNPTPGGKIRKPDFLIDRGTHSHFFNFVWQAFLTGILKTLGVPVKLVIK